MNARQMASALRAFGDLIGGNEGAALLKFAHAFDGMGEAKAAAVITQVAKNWKAEGREVKRPAELESAVSQIEKVLTATGARAQAAAFGKVLPILVGSEDQDIDGFVGDVVAARVKRAPPPKSPKASKATKVIRVAKPKKLKFADLAPDLAKRLTLAAYDRIQFDALLSDYERRFKPAEMKAIADRYLGFSVNKTKKDDIVKAVRNWQREEELNWDSHVSQAKAGL